MLPTDDRPGSQRLNLGVARPRHHRTYGPSSCRGVPHTSTWNVEFGRGISVPRRYRRASWRIGWRTGLVRRARGIKKEYGRASTGGTSQAHRLKGLRGDSLVWVFPGIHDHSVPAPRRDHGSQYRILRNSVRRSSFEHPIRASDCGRSRVYCRRQGRERAVDAALRISRRRLRA